MSNIPRTIEEAVGALDKILIPEDREWVRSNPREAVEAVLHHSLGRWIRNTWGLWKGDSELFCYLQALGFSHADDMSGIIIHFYWKHCHRESWDGLDEEIARYRAHWAGLSDTLEKIGK